MSQNINLFNPAFRKQRQLVTMNALAGCLAVALLTLLGVQAYLQQDVAGLTEELRSSEALLKVQRGYTDKLQREAAMRKSSIQLETEIARLETELKQGRDAMEALRNNAIGTQEGFSEYLRAFARESTNGLWLTGLTIGGGGDIEIRGRVLSAELVSGYIQRLNREKVLAGRSFARLQMAQLKADPEKSREKDAKSAPQPAPFLEFSLATADASRPEKTP
jgi:hypothetical protein